MTYDYKSRTGVRSLLIVNNVEVVIVKTISLIQNPPVNNSNIQIPVVQ